LHKFNTGEADLCGMVLANIHFDNPHLVPSEVARGLQYLPSAPRVLPRLYASLRNGNASLQQIGALIRIDPGMTARVFQLANERFALRGEICVTLEDAINSLGYGELSELITRVADEQALAESVNLYGLDADEMWRWCLASALAAEVLAEHAGADPALAYTTALLHGAGMLALEEWARAHDPLLTFAPPLSVREWTEAERALFGITQAEVSAVLLRSWGFPSSVVEPVRWQYAPFSSSRTGCILHTAKWLRFVVCTDDQPAPAMPALAVLKTLHLTPDRLAKMVVEVRVKLGVVRNFVDFAAA
jgi:HD-like signal output (HDOD) protein